MMYAPYPRPLARTPRRLFTFALVCMLTLTTLLVQRPLVLPHAPFAAAPMFDGIRNAFVAQSATSINWYVAPTGDDTNDCLSISTPCLTIAATIGKADSGGTISIAAGIYIENLTITKNLMLTGVDKATTIIDGTLAGAVLTILGQANVSISGVTLQHGKSSNGGGINNLGGTVALTNSAINHNIATDLAGGGIYNSGGILTLTDSDVISNTLVGINRIDGGGGGVYSNGGHITVTNSTISDNRVSKFGLGAGIDIINATLDMIGTTVDSNSTAFGDGGGIFAYTSTLTLQASTISNNTSLYGGGIEVYLSGSSLTLNTSRVSGNTATYAGGGINNAGGVLVVRDSTISDNVANNSTDGGGGIANAGDTTLIRSIISGNAATQGTGGGIDNTQGPDKLLLDGTIVSNNTASSFGGGIYSVGGRVILINNSRVSDNKTTSLGAHGGGLYLDTVTLEMTQSTVDGNSSALGDGGGIWAGEISTLILDTSTVSNNTAPNGGGGGILVDNSALTLNTSTISHNTAMDGGGIKSIKGTLSFQNSTIADNTASNQVGGIYRVDPSTILMRNSILANNHNTSSPDCNGPITSQGYNLIGTTTGCTFTSVTGDQVNVDPKLGPLQNNGGPTPTHALLPGSPAIDKGNPAAPGSSANACLARDQRGVVRPRDGDGDTHAICDIGAYEADTLGHPSFLDLAKTVSPAVAHPGDTLTYTLRVTATGDTAMATLTDRLPPGLTNVVNVTGGATFDAATREIRFNGSVAPGSPLTITYQATVAADVKPGSVIANTAGVTGTGYLLTKVASVAVADPSFGGNLLLIYGEGDNNLSKEMLHVINSAERAAGQNGLVIFMVIDGPGVDDSYLYRLEADQDASCPNYSNPTCSGRYVEGQNMWRWSEDVANPYSLSEFIKGAVRAYPKAGKIALSLVGHGGGWSPEVLAGQPSGRGAMPGEDPLGGLLWDQNPGTSLSTPALGEALRWSTPALKEATGRDKIDLLFLDACFMGMAEVGYELRDSVHYLLASENWKWAVGDYDKLGAAMTAGDVRQIGTAWLTSETDTLHDENYPFTYSLLDLSALDGLRVASDDLAKALTPVLITDNKRIADAAHATDCFDSDTSGKIDAKDNYCDLGSFAQQLASQFRDNPTIADAARRVVQAAATAVVDSDHQNGTPWPFPGQPWIWNNPSGISVFLPLAEDSWKRRYYGSLQWSADGEWDSMLAAWYSNAAPPFDPTCPAGGCVLPPPPLSVRYMIRLPVVMR